MTLHLNPAFLQASCTPAKAGAVTPRDVFDDLRAPGTMAGLVADSAIDVGADPAGSEDGTIKSHRALDAGAAGACPEGLHGSPPMTARSDVFDFLATPRTEAALFGPPQVSCSYRTGVVGLPAHACRAALFRKIVSCAAH